MRLVLAAATAALLAGGAQAATIVYNPGTFGAPNGFTLINTFDTAADQAAVSGSGFIFQTGSNGQGAALPGNNTPYLSVLGNGAATINFSQVVRSLAFDFSTLDTYNMLTVNFSTGPSDMVSGDDFLAAGAPNGATSGSFRVNGDGRLITSITLGSTSNSFEVDNLSISAVPEASTWAMMIVGFGLVGSAMRRRTTARVSA